MVVLVLQHSLHLSSVDGELLHVVETCVEALGDFLLEVNEHSVLHASVLIEYIFEVFDSEFDLVLLGDENTSLLTDFLHLLAEQF